MLTAIEHGSVGPKRMAKAISESKAVLTHENFKRKGGVSKSLDKRYVPLAQIRNVFGPRSQSIQSEYA